MKIGELSQRTNLSTHTIRYYEKLGLIKAAKKDVSGHRAYSNRDVELVNWIACLKNSGMTLDNIQQYIHAFNEDDAHTMTTMLQLHLDKLQEKQENIVHYIDVTQRKINNLKSA